MQLLLLVVGLIHLVFGSEVGLNEPQNFRTTWADETTLNSIFLRWQRVILVENRWLESFRTTYRII